MKKIKYGKKSVLTPEEMNPENVRVLISIWINGVVLLALRKEATKRGIKYQTLINRKLREMFEAARFKEMPIVKVKNR